MVPFAVNCGFHVPAVEWEYCVSVHQPVSQENTLFETSSVCQSVLERLSPVPHRWGSSASPPRWDSCQGTTGDPQGVCRVTDQALPCSLALHFSETPMTETWILATKYIVLNTDNETEGINSHVEKCKPTAVHKDRKDVYHLLSSIPSSHSSWAVTSHHKHWSQHTISLSHLWQKPVILCSKITELNFHWERIISVLLAWL